MAILRRSFAFPRQWNPTQVPTFPVEVDTTHPLGQGLSYFHLYGIRPSPLYLARGGLSLGYQSGALVGGFSSGPGFAGYGGFVGQSTTSQYANNTYGVNQAQGTMLFYLTMGWAPGYQPNLEACLFSSLAPGPSAPELTFQQFGTYLYCGWNNGGDARLNFVNLGYWSSLQTLSMGFLWNYNSASPSSSITSALINGSTAATRTGSFTAFDTGDGNQAFAVGNTLELQSNNWISSAQAPIYAGAIWDVALTANLVAWFNTEPFAMLRPIVRRQYYVPAAGGTAHNGLWLVSSLSAAPSAAAIARKALSLGSDNAAAAGRATVGRYGVVASGDFTAAAANGKAARRGLFATADQAASAPGGKAARQGIATTTSQSTIPSRAAVGRSVILMSSGITGANGFGKAGRAGAVAVSALSSIGMKGSTARHGLMSATALTAWIARGGLPSSFIPFAPIIWIG